MVVVFIPMSGVAANLLYICPPETQSMLYNLVIGMSRNSVSFRSIKVSDGLGSSGDQVAANALLWQENTQARSATVVSSDNIIFLFILFLVLVLVKVLVLV